MIRFVRLRDTADLQAFSEAYAAHGGSPFPLSYLQSSRVYALRQGQGPLLGGFVLHGPRPDRILSQMPPAAQTTLTQLQGQQSCCEMSGLFLAYSLRKSWLGFALWLWAFLMVLRFPAHWLACAATKPGLRPYYQHAPGAQLVYAGPWPAHPGKNIWVYMAPKRRAILGGILRILRQRWLKQRRLSTPSTKALRWGRAA